MIVLLSIFPIFLWTFIHPQGHKLLRNPANYIAILVLTLALLIASATSFECNLKAFEKRNILAPISLLAFLFLYKLCDKLCIKKYGRHMFFSVRYNSVWQDGESDESTFFESILQMLLIFAPLLVWQGLSWLILQCIDKYNC